MGWLKALGLWVVVLHLKGSGSGSELFYRFSVGRVFVLRNPNWEFWDIGCFRSWSKDASPVCICFRLKFSQPRWEALHSKP